MIKIPTEDEQYFAYREEIQFHLDLFNKYAEYLYLSSKPAPTGIQFVLTYQAEDPQKMVCILPNRSPVLVTYPRWRVGGIPSNTEVEDVLSSDHVPPVAEIDRKLISSCLIATILFGLVFFLLKWWVATFVLWVSAMAVYGWFAHMYNKNVNIKRPTFSVTELTDQEHDDLIEEIANRLEQYYHTVY